MKLFLILLVTCAVMLFLLTWTNTGKKVKIPAIIAGPGQAAPTKIAEPAVSAPTVATDKIDQVDSVVQGNLVAEMAINGTRLGPNQGQ